MVVAVASWALEIEPGKRFSLIAERDFRITNACFGNELADEKGRSVVEVKIDEPVFDDDEDDEEDEESETIKTVLCSLRAGVCEQSSLDVTFLEGQQIEFSVSGKNKVHLLGNYIDQDPFDQPPLGEDSDLDSEDDDGYPLQDFSSDVEMGPDGIDDDDDEDDESRFEELPDTKPDSKKRPRPSDSADEGKLSKNQQKKLNKKLKAEDGSAVPVGKEEEKSKSKDSEKEKSKSKADAEKLKNEKSKSKDGDKSKGKAGDEKPKTKAASEAKTLAGGLIVQDVKLGTGPGAKKGQKLSMRYIGKFTNGKVFDKNTGGAPFTFKLGKGQVIAGWDIGLLGMQPGGERLLTIPGHLAYGSSPPAGIPKNATLIFEVKLISAV